LEPPLLAVAQWLHPFIQTEQTGRWVDMADAVQKLVDQILAQGTSSKWTGEGFGGAEKNAREMAKMLSGIGITDINQFGKIKTPARDTGGGAPAGVYQNDPNDPSKGYYTFEHMLQPGAGEDGGPGIVATKNKVPVDPKDIRQEQSMYYDEATERHVTTPFLTTRAPIYEEALGNKVTNQRFDDPNRYDQRYGNIFSGTYAGKDQTQFGVQFRPDGTPVFYTQKGESTSNAGEIMQIAGLGLSLFAPGIGGAIGSALTGTAATTVLSKVVGAAIVQGTMAELSGGNFKDGAISGAIGAGMAPLVSNTIGSAVADAMGDSAFSKVVNNAVNSAATAGLTAGLTGKGDVLDSALNAAVASVGNTYGRELGGDTGAKIGTALGKIATGADAEQVLTSTIMDTLKSTVTGALKEDGKGKDKSGGGDGDDALIGGAGDDSIDDLIGLTPTEVGDRGAVENVSVGEEDSLDGGVSTDTTGADTTGADTTGANDVLNGLLSGNGVTNEDDLLGGLGDDTLEGGVSTDTTGADSVAGGAEDPLLGLSSAEVGQGELDAINDDALLGLSSAEVGQGELDAINDDALLGLSSAEVGQGEVDAINDDALLGLSSAEVGQGEVDAINNDALLNLSSAEVGQGEKDAIDYDALLGLSSAEVGQGEKDAIDAALNTGAVSTGGAKTTTGGGTTNTTTTNTTTKAADTSSGVDILSLLALMGGEQKPVQQKQEVNDDPFVEFDFNSPFRVNPFAPRSPTPRMAEGGSIDELLELLQYRG
jgi:hypothetical protein